MRMARLVHDSPDTERVADMFAGIGYFTIPLAGSGASVHAMEINPVAFGFLHRNPSGQTAFPAASRPPRGLPGSPYRHL